MKIGRMSRENLVAAGGAMGLSLQPVKFTDWTPARIERNRINTAAFLYIHTIVTSNL
jgi:hypothetical protein